MKKLLIILLIVCLLVIGYMITTKDTNVTADKVYKWAQKEIPEKLAEMYTIKGYDIIDNKDGTIDVVLHCEKNNNGDE